MLAGAPSVQLHRGCGSAAAAHPSAHHYQHICLSTLLTLLFPSRQVWNPRTGACLRTMDSGYGLCALFAPGNRHALVGTKEGTIEIFDVGTSSRIAVVK